MPAHNHLKNGEIFILLFDFQKLFYIIFYFLNFHLDVNCDPEHEYQSANGSVDDRQDAQIGEQADNGHQEASHA